MKNKPISCFLILALAFIYKANAGKIVGALVASNGPIVSSDELIDREWEQFGNETMNRGKTNFRIYFSKLIYDYVQTITH